MTNRTASNAAERAFAESYARGVKLERERLRQILESDEAVGRRGLATHLALETDIAPEAVKKLLAVAANTDEAPNSEAARFYTAMAARGQAPRPASTSSFVADSLKIFAPKPTTPGSSAA